MPCNQDFRLKFSQIRWKIAIFELYNDEFGLWFLIIIGYRSAISHINNQGQLNRHGSSLFTYPSANNRSLSRYISKSSKRLATALLIFKADLAMG